MNKFDRCYRFLAMLTVFLMLFSCAACSGQKKPQTQSPSKSSQEEKAPPKELDKLKSSIEKIEKSLKTIYEENKKPLFMQEDKLKTQGGKQQDKGGGSSGGQSQGGQGGQGGGQSGGSQNGQSSGSQGGQQQAQQQVQQLSPELLKEKVLQDKYKKLDAMKKDVIDVHTAWNSYEPKAIADLVPQTVIEEFEAALNSLTDAVNKQDVYLSMLDVNQLKKYLPDFYTLYKTKYPPDLDRVRFAVTKIQLLTDAKDYEGTTTVLTYLDTVWAAAKPKLKKDNMEQLNKFDLALVDLRKALESKNDTVIEAKTQVIMNIMDEIEKSAKKGSK